MPGINLIIFDTECLVHDNPGQIQLTDHLLASNRDFFNMEKERIVQAQFKRIILAETNSGRKLEHGKYILPILQHHVANMLPAVPVEFDQLWSTLTDSIKTSINAIAGELNDPAITAELLNRYGILDISALAHRAATSYSDEPITISFYTSNQNRYMGANNFFKQHPDLLPPNVIAIDFTLYANNEIMRPDPTDNPVIKGTGISNTSFDTEKKYTTASALRSEKKLPAGLLATPDTTARLLVEEEVVLPTIDIEVGGQTSISSSSGSTGLFSKPARKMPETWVRQFNTLVKDYSESILTSEQFLTYILPYKIRNANEAPPTDAELLSLLQQIASDREWEKKGKVLNPFANRVTPSSVKKASEANPQSFAELAAIVAPQLKEHDAAPANTGFIKRSRTTVDFYRLIATLGNSSLSNYAREVALYAFCKKYNLNYCKDRHLKDVTCVDENSQSSQTLPTSFQNQLKAFISDYKNSKLTSAKFLDYVRPFKISAPDESESLQKNLLPVVKQIADHSMWNTMGKSFIPYSTPFTPGGILEIRKCDATTFGGLAKVVEPKLNEILGKYKRNQAVLDFYSLIVGLSDPSLNDHVREIGLFAFCEKYRSDTIKLDYDEMLKSQASPATGSLAHGFK